MTEYDAVLALLKVRGNNCKRNYSMQLHLHVAPLLYLQYVRYKAQGAISSERPTLEVNQTRSISSYCMFRASKTRITNATLLQRFDCMQAMCKAETVRVESAAQ